MSFLFSVFSGSDARSIRPLTVEEVEASLPTPSKPVVVATALAPAAAPAGEEEEQNVNAMEDLHHTTNDLHPVDHDSEQAQTDFVPETEPAQNDPPIFLTTSVIRSVSSTFVHHVEFNSELLLSNTPLAGFASGVFEENQQLSTIFLDGCGLRHLKEGEVEFLETASFVGGAGGDVVATEHLRHDDIDHHEDHSTTAGECAIDEVELNYEELQSKGTINTRDDSSTIWVVEAPSNAFDVNQAAALPLGTTTNKLTVLSPRAERGSVDVSRVSPRTSTVAATDEKASTSGPAPEEEPEVGRVEDFEGGQHQHQGGGTPPGTSVAAISSSTTSTGSTVGAIASTVHAEMREYLSNVGSWLYDVSTAAGGRRRSSSTDRDRDHDPFELHVVRPALRPLQSLQQLYLMRNELTQLDGADLPASLVVCDVSDNHISDLQFQFPLPRLRQLNLAGNRLGDFYAIGGLRNLTNLVALDLSRNLFFRNYSHAGARARAEGRRKNEEMLLALGAFFYLVVAGPGAGPAGAPAGGVRGGGPSTAAPTGARARFDSLRSLRILEDGHEKGAGSRISRSTATKPAPQEVEQQKQNPYDLGDDVIQNYRETLGMELESLALLDDVPIARTNFEDGGPGETAQQPGKSSTTAHVASVDLLGEMEMGARGPRNEVEPEQSHDPDPPSQGAGPAEAAPSGHDQLDLPQEKLQMRINAAHCGSVDVDEMIRELQQQKTDFVLGLVEDQDGDGDGGGNAGRGRFGAAEVEHEVEEQHVHEAQDCWKGEEPRFPNERYNEYEQSSSCLDVVAPLVKSPRPLLGGRGGRGGGVRNNEGSGAWISTTGSGRARAGTRNPCEEDASHDLLQNDIGSEDEGFEAGDHLDGDDGDAARPMMNTSNTRSATSSATGARPHSGGRNSRHSSSKPTGGGTPSSSATSAATPKPETHNLLDL